MIPISAVEHNALIHLAEEAGELVQAAIKLIRFGRGGLDPNTGVFYNNVTDLVREFNDVQKRFHEFMDGKYTPYPVAEPAPDNTAQYYFDGARNEADS